VPCLAVKGKVEAVSERNVVVAEAVVEVVVGAAQDPLGGVFMFHGAGVLKTIRPNARFIEPPWHRVDEEANIMSS